MAGFVNSTANFAARAAAAAARRKAADQRKQQQHQQRAQGAALAAPVAAAAPAAGPEPTAELPWAAAFARLAEQDRVDRQARGLLAQGSRDDLTKDAYGWNTVAEWQQAGGSFNANDPFSRAALLNRAHQVRTTGSNTIAAASGQLHSGAYERQRGVDQETNALAVNELTRDYERGISEIDRREQEQNAAGANSLYGVLEQLLRETASDPTAAYDPGAGAAAPAGAAAGSGSRWASGVVRNGVDIGVLDKAMSLPAARGKSRAQVAQLMRENPDWGPWTLANGGRLRGHSVAF